MERYESAQRPWSVALAHQSLGRVARNDEERDRHVAAARSVWGAIGFDHLIAELDDEFGPA